ncbi:hypothetical protein AbraIFM66950_006287 [Aspergillus brasiliensis]|nr:hypothetical protein AbraIFM66950_006287 [Aspergillus brasiliensis]
MTIPSVTALGDDPNTTHRLNACAYQQSAITTSGSIQYVAFYTSRGVADSRRVTIARHDFRDTSSDWQYLTFEDYNQTTDDGHNTISIGICAGDGTIHVSFDHHCDALKYRISRPGLANDPSELSWTAGNFSPILDHLPGCDGLLDVTYPRFIPTDKEMYFECRIGNLHVTWTNRHFIEYEGASDSASTAHKAQAGPNGPENNEGLYYAYSQDNGVTWNGPNQKSVTVLSARPGTGLESQDSRLLVRDIPRNSSVMNQEAQYVDSTGGVHVLNRENTAGKETWMHYYRSPSDNEWSFFVLPDIYPTPTGPRGKLVHSEKLKTVFFVLPSNTENELLIARRSMRDIDGEFSVVWRQHGYSGEPLIDEEAFKTFGVLSILILRGDQEGNRKVVVLQFDVNKMA